MRVPLGWLRDYVDLPADVDAIVARLATLGFPVETVEQRPVISGVLAGSIVELAKHPNADRLQVCRLDVGAAAPLTIATAATNVALHQVVPVATIGAQLPQLKIEPRKMRGIDSQGMLCSADELGLVPEWFEDGILQLDASTPNGTDVVAFFGLHLPVLDIEIGANRGDAFSMVGIARELSAAFGTPLRFPPPEGASAERTNGAPSTAGDVRVTLESLDARRYIAQRVSHLEVRRGTAAIRIRLALAGQRPISNLVDISNFVMLELGQPLHFFDFEKIAGKHIIVRDARPRERLTTLDGTDRELDPTALVIADDEQATGLAGLMGGLISEVSDSTREIVIESANFSGPRVRRMSVKLGLRSEASTRNEKNLPPALADLGAARAAFLLEREGGTAAPPRAYGKPLEPPAIIQLAQRDVGRLLGFDVTADELRRALEALGFTVAPVPSDDGARFSVGVPGWRSDVTIAPDLVEEIARIIGYDHVRAELPPIAAQPLDSAAYDREMAIARTLAGLGYAECLTLALQPQSVAERWRSFGLDVPACVEIRNPLSEDQRWMRFSILPALLEHAARERALRPLRTFEIGHVFADEPAAPREINVLTTLATTRPVAGQPAWRDAAFLAASADVRALVRTITGSDARLERGTMSGLHPGKTARILAAGTAVGYVGSVDPRLLRAVDIGDDAVCAVVFIDDLPPHRVHPYRPLSRYPAIERDLAIVVDPRVSAADIQATIRASTPLARSVEVFDEYRGPQIGASKKSLAVRVVLQRDDTTLTDGEADAILQLALSELGAAHGATLRG
ncbi:MAG: phenylalanine--tRNA ligase subunit beta [Candidatus Velthaea sp.]|jgi:phenylalanyl-tRNA synthetase beta chain